MCATHTHTHTHQRYACLIAGILISAMSIFFSSCGNSNLSSSNSNQQINNPANLNPLQTKDSLAKSNPAIHPLNFSPGITYRSGSTIAWIVNTSELIDETYIKWGKERNNLEHTGKRYFATLSLYKDKINIDSDGLYYLEIVAEIGGKEIINGPFQFYGKQDSQIYTALPQQLQLTDTQGERTIEIAPAAFSIEVESSQQDIDNGRTLDDTTDHRWTGISTVGGPCLVISTHTDNVANTTVSGWWFCSSSDIELNWRQSNSDYDGLYKSSNSNSSYTDATSGHSESNTIKSTITYQLPSTQQYEIIKSVVTLPIQYSVMQDGTTYTLGGQIPTIIGDTQCPEPSKEAWNSCGSVDWGNGCYISGCDSYNDVQHNPCTAYLTWDVSSLAPTMGGTFQLELKGSGGGLPTYDEGSYKYTGTYECNGNLINDTLQQGDYSYQLDYISGGLPWASVTYKCEQKYIINIYGDLTYGYFIPPDIEPKVSDIDIPVQLKPVCENEDVSNKTLVFDIKRVDSSNEYENGGHSHDDATVSTAIGFFDNNTCTTDSSGSCDVIWHPPEASGLYELKVYVDGEPDVANTQRFMVGVEGLTSLVPSSYYRLKGQRPAHPDNHWAMEDVIGYIQQMSSSFYRDHNNATLGINDMSLVYGGLFDISADWNIPHSLHRLGRSVDIDSHAETLDGHCLQVDKGVISRLCQEYGYGHLEPEATIHCEYPPEFYASSGGGGGGCGGHPCM